VGPDVAGSYSLGNHPYGAIDIAGQAHDNVIGGLAPGEGNLISGNQMDGIALFDTYDNRLLGNIIGLTLDGSQALPNLGPGVFNVSYAVHTWIEGNTISGNQTNGVQLSGATEFSATVISNRLGTDITGTRPIANGWYGVFLSDGAQSNLVENNLISGNGNGGIWASDSISNVVMGNLVGTDVNGTSAVGNNGYGLWMQNGRGNRVGGMTAAEGNTISGNAGGGVWIGGNTISNTVLGNYIGTDVAGAAAMGNSGSGIFVCCGAHQSAIGPNNVIAFNGTSGVKVDGQDTLSNMIRANSIFSNTGPGILLTAGGNSGTSNPAITTATATLVAGFASPNAWVEVFSDVLDEGRVYEGSTQSDAEGHWSLDRPGGFAGPNLTATATDMAGNTSEFSPPIPAQFVPPPPDTYEPNDTCAQAYPINISLGATQVFTSYIGRADDIDLYKLDLSAPYTVIAITLTEPISLETYFNVYSGTCQSGLPRAWVTPRTWGTDASMNKVILYNIGPYMGTYYIWVGSMNHRWSKFPYTLSVSIRQGEPGEDIYGSNDSCNLAAPIMPGQVITGFIFPITDTDIYSFTVPMPGIQAVITLTSVFSYDVALYDICENNILGSWHSPREWVTDRSAAVKTIVYNVGPYPGNYFVQVYGFDGVYNADNAYQLEVQTRQPVTESVKTLILYNRERLQTLYGAPAADTLVAKLQQLAAHPAVVGHLIDVDADPFVRYTYRQWVQTNPDRANDVSMAIKSMLLAELGRYPDVQYMVIVGNDRVIPFRRVPDRSWFLEHAYVGFGHILSTNAIGAALYGNYFLSDDFYADRSPTYWRWHDLYIPDFAIGRLVETPQEIGDFIDTFLAGDSVMVHSGLVAGYDFLVDASGIMADQMITRGITPVMRLISDTWNTGDLDRALLQTHQDIAALNVHADHWGLGTPLDAGISSTLIVASPITMSRAAFFTPGCHSGLNIPDIDSNPHTVLDLAQAFARKQVNWIGNTGYGIGGDGTPLSEQVMLFLNDELTRGSLRSIGAALVRAKQRYYTSLPRPVFDYNDEKVMSEVVLYGLPMYTLKASLATGKVVEPLGRRAPASSQPASGCSAQQLYTYTPMLELVPSAVGVYYRASNPDLESGVYARPDQPIQPRLSESVDSNAHGLVFEGGHYTVPAGFDPTIVRLASSDERITEEVKLTGAEWLPANPAALSQLETLQGNQPRLVVVPGQYRGLDAQERIYDRITATLYISTADDVITPTITSVTYVVSSDAVTVTVKATDESGICRALLTYTDGQGSWRSLDLVPASTDVWRGTLSPIRWVEFFIQVVDTAGNVAVNDNDARYYHANHWVFLPVILRAGQ
jgi:parallel beta-helix repeat protein